VRPAGVHRPLVVGGIRHVGSNSVPGLRVKSVIDILVGVENLERSWPCKEKVASLGYLYWPYRSDVMHWLLKPDPARRTHHLHLVPVGSCRHQDELAFRDASSTRSASAGRYAAPKRDLAARFPYDREAYNSARRPSRRHHGRRCGLLRAESRSFPLVWWLIVLP
jgi:GrpB-like predicted nucleotidyltransferase (UPF0157 family)